MSRFFVSKEFVKGNSIHISQKEAHHILNVMRLKVSDEVTVFDGTGKEYVGIIKKSGHRSLEVEIKEVRKSAGKEDYSVTLIQAIAKKDKMDYISQKATELGVFCIVPVVTERTIPDWNNEKKTSMVERWQRISLEAAKQCGRLDIPEISRIVSFEELIRHCEEPKAIACLAALGFAERRARPLASPVIASPLKGLAMTVWDYDIKLIAALSDKAIKIKDVLRGRRGMKIAIAIGPEGDFTPEEIEEAVRAGFKVVNLGPLTLKSDTAGPAVLSMINYEYRD
ncbi:MAG: RsmE family RNA methyltransferase [Candidatus Omnitrophota bacterium]|nr:RsmE family RNA methyltransferase [Candidatus Omnitrophota bacterium]